MNWRDYITSDPAVLAGKPVVRGTRISVEFLLKLLAGGWTRDQILREHPHLSARRSKRPCSSPPRQSNMSGSFRCPAPARRSAGCSPTSICCYRRALVRCGRPVTMSWPSPRRPEERQI
jgi:hypothetical protein